MVGDRLRGFQPSGAHYPEPEGSGTAVYRFPEERRPTHRQRTQGAHQPWSLQPRRVHRSGLVGHRGRDGRTLHRTHRTGPHQGSAGDNAEGRRNVRQGRGEVEASQVVGLHPTGRRHLPHTLGEPAPHPRELEGEGQREHPLHLLRRNGSPGPERRPLRPVPVLERRLVVLARELAGLRLRSAQRVGGSRKLALWAKVTVSFLDPLTLALHPA